MEDVMASKNPFFTRTESIVGHSVASIEAKLLLPLKTYAYGVAPKCFCDYFQMSFPFAATVCKEFDEIMVSLYAKEYLRTPTPNDIKSIVALHKHVHGVDGLFAGSLDCTHTYWKHCPAAWKGQFKGRNPLPSIVLEAACDYNLWFWHLSYGHCCGCLNDDINILNRSPLWLDMMLDGHLHELEQEAGVVPFHIAEEFFDKLFLFLVDGIYPKYNRFVHSYKTPITSEQQRYSGWQEAVRKDIERAFGVLKAQWQILARPIMLHTLLEIAKRASTCFILHKNMLVSDRVMGDCRLLYDPAELVNTIKYKAKDVTQPSDLEDVQRSDRSPPWMRRATPPKRADIGVVITRGDRFRELQNPAEYQRLLHTTLMSVFGEPRDNNNNN
jgi:hypothetical protein